ncbi:hypothetical protein CXG50_10005 [Pseudomonas plecoglossicida]|nr:hypothetical protein CX682_25875 [Pseudomonas sp. FFUP_PS_41]PLV09598.1 hypothetical protein CXG50_10005 [Pseudomonas plecoglossicida]QKK94786.1 hypothetical protein GEV38_01580 [Pseudomonas sp. 13159349]
MGASNSRGRFAAHRRQASSHRYCASPETCAIPVGAGLPAMRPRQPAQGLRPAPPCRSGLVPRWATQ